MVYQQIISWSTTHQHYTRRKQKQERSWPYVFETNNNNNSYGIVRRHQQSNNISKGNDGDFTMVCPIFDLQILTHWILILIIKMKHIFFFLLEEQKTTGKIVLDCFHVRIFWYICFAKSKYISKRSGIVFQHHFSTCTLSCLANFFIHTKNKILISHEQFLPSLDQSNTNLFFCVKTNNSHSCLQCGSSSRVPYTKKYILSVGLYGRWIYQFMCSICFRIATRNLFAP